MVRDRNSSGDELNRFLSICNSVGYTTATPLLHHCSLHHQPEVYEELLPLAVRLRRIVVILLHVGSGPDVSLVLRLDVVGAVVGEDHYGRLGEKRCKKGSKRNTIADIWPMHP